jgi:membrane fusion protein, multidrug efflux system
VTLWADGGRVYDAKLREVSPQADPATRTYRARYSLIKPDAAITLGKTATVHLASPGAGERAKVPLAAVFKDQGRPSVWLIDEARGRLIKTGVEVSAWTETSAIVSGGLGD